LQFQIQGFVANLHSLNFKKTQHIQFITKNNMRLLARKLDMVTQLFQMFLIQNFLI